MNKIIFKIHKTLSEDYYRMKLQWKTISKDQESRFSEFAARKALIGILQSDLSLFAFLDIFFIYLLYKNDPFN